MDSIGTNITTALDVVRQIDEQASRMVRRIQILEEANREQGDVIADLRHRVEQLDAENHNLNHTAELEQATECDREQAATITAHSERIAQARLRRVEELEAALDRIMATCADAR